MKRNQVAVKIAILILLACFISNIAMAQKINLDTLSIDQLNLYRDKAVRMNTAGIILTAGGIGIMLTGLGLLTNYAFTVPYEDWEDSVTNLYAILTLGGTASAITGACLWTIGGKRKAKAELTLQKYKLAPQNSMAVGLGITIRF
jgi:hypothetical protein